MNQNLRLPADRLYLSSQIKVAFVGNDFKDQVLEDLSLNFDISCSDSIEMLENTLLNSSFLDLPDVLLLEIDNDGLCFSFIERIKKQPSLRGMIIVLLGVSKRAEWKIQSIALRVDDFYTYPFEANDLHERIKFLIKMRVIKPWQVNSLNTNNERLSYKMPWSKRLFDVIASATALFLLSPLFLMIALLITIESKGPAIYRSKRVGTGYKVFNFYKFRSMYVSADKELGNLAAFNQYTLTEDKKPVFTKIVNDPRITKVGQFIRNTSIDELPQLFNILLGDMSFVGNRPLPVYEAELLTSNEWSMRFLGPAGLTGLWQITKRGKKEMSETERKELDNYYSQKHSFFLDMKIILKTFPALIQNEKV